MKKLISMLIALAFMLAGAAPLAGAIDEQISTKNHIDLIYQYYSAINDNDYEAYLASLGGVFKTDMTMALPMLIKEQIGVAVIKSVDLKSVRVLADITETQYSEVPDLRMQNTTALQQIKDMRNYLVECNMEVYNDNEYFFNGTNYASIVCGVIDGELKIIDNKLPLPDEVAEFEPDRIRVSDYFKARFPDESRGFSISDKFSEEFKDVASYNGVMPTSIKVLRVSKNKIETPDFKQYCRVVMVCEEGYESRQKDYKQAFALAIKHFGWYRVLKPQGDRGCDVRDTVDDQLYTPEGKSLSDWPTCDKAMLDTWNTIMVNSSRQIFKPEYRNEKANLYAYGEKKYQGIMYEWQVWKTLVPRGMNYIDVLKYYYSYNSSGDGTGTSVGEVRVCRNHTGSYVNITPTKHTVQTCTTCKVHIAEDHTWRLQGNNQVCTKCGFSITVMSIPEHPMNIVNLPA